MIKRKEKSNEKSNEKLCKNEGFKSCKDKMAAAVLSSKSNNKDENMYCKKMGFETCLKRDNYIKGKKSKIVEKFGNYESDRKLDEKYYNKFKDYINKKLCSKISKNCPSNEKSDKNKSKVKENKTIDHNEKICKEQGYYNCKIKDINYKLFNKNWDKDFSNIQEIQNEAKKMLNIATKDYKDSKSKLCARHLINKDYDKFFKNCDEKSFKKYKESYCDAHLSSNSTSILSSNSLLEKHLKNCKSNFNTEYCKFINKYGSDDTYNKWKSKCKDKNDPFTKYNCEKLLYSPNINPNYMPNIGRCNNAGFITQPYINKFCNSIPKECRNKKCAKLKYNYKIQKKYCKNGKAIDLKKHFEELEKKKIKPKADAKAKTDETNKEFNCDKSRIRRRKPFNLDKECPWGENGDKHSGKKNVLVCMDGTECNVKMCGYECCNDRGGRAQCHPKFKYMNNVWNASKKRIGCSSKKKSNDQRRKCNESLEDIKNKYKADKENPCLKLGYKSCEEKKKIEELNKEYKCNKTRIRRRKPFNLDKECPWGNNGDKHSGKKNVIVCMDGTECNTNICGWGCCNDRGGGAQCSPKYPLMTNKWLPDMKKVNCTDKIGRPNVEIRKCNESLEDIKNKYEKSQNKLQDEKLCKYYGFKSCKEFTKDCKDLKCEKFLSKQLECKKENYRGCDFKLNGKKPDKKKHSDNQEIKCRIEGYESCWDKIWCEKYKYPKNCIEKSKKKIKENTKKCKEKGFDSCKDYQKFKDIKLQSTCNKSCESACIYDSSIYTKSHYCFVDPSKTDKKCIDLDNNKSTLGCNPKIKTIKGKNKKIEKMLYDKRMKLNKK